MDNFKDNLKTLKSEILACLDKFRKNNPTATIKMSHWETEVFDSGESFKTIDEISLGGYRDKYEEA